MFLNVFVGFLCFTECSYLIICVYQFYSFLHKLKVSYEGYAVDEYTINRSSSKAVRVCMGGLKFDKNDLSPAVQKILAIKCLLWGINCTNIF